MTELETLIGEELDALAPDPIRAADWDAIMRRARPPLYRRPLVLAVAGLVAVLACAAAVAAGLGGFDRWFSGTPGTPAPERVQRGFESANGRSWAAFPASTQLRELIRTTVGGRTYVLEGFRSGTSLCLRLNGQMQSCAPTSLLAHISAPIVPVRGEGTFTHTSRYHLVPTAEFSFGIVADGVSAVSVRAVDGVHRAILGGNAYLFVENDPNTANHVLSVTAIRSEGRRTTVPITTSLGGPWPFGLTVRKSHPRLPGPTRATARIRHPRIGWYDRGEKRGLSLAQARLTSEQRREIGSLSNGGLRLLKPDPLSNVLVGLSGNLCVTIVNGSEGAGEGCSPQGQLFSQGPVDLVGSGGSVAGVVADGVSRIRIFLSDGELQTASLRDNAFTAPVAASEFPIRIVAYDNRGHIVWTEKWPGLVAGQVPEKALRLRPVLRVRGPEGTLAVLRVGRRVRGFHCWRVSFSTGQTPGGCVPRIGGGSSVSLDVLQPAGRDLFLVGSAGVSRVKLRFADGPIASARSVRGHYVLPVPKRYLDGKRHFASLFGVNAFGFKVQRRGVFFRSSP
jgi:hypothetical protein